MSPKWPPYCSFLLIFKKCAEQSWPNYAHASSIYRIALKREKYKLNGILTIRTMKTGELNYIKYKGIKVIHFTGNVNIKFSVL